MIMNIIVRIVIDIFSPHPVPLNQINIVIIKATEAANRRMVYVSNIPFLQVSSLVSPDTR